MKAQGIWERHSERLRRQAQLERFNQWRLDHPWKMRLLVLGWGILIGEIALALRYGLDQLGRMAGP